MRRVGPVEDEVDEGEGLGDDREAGPRHEVVEEEEEDGSSGSESDVSITFAPRRMVLTRSIAVGIGRGRRCRRLGGRRERSSQGPQCHHRGRRGRIQSRTRQDARQHGRSEESRRTETRSERTLRQAGPGSNDGGRGGRGEGGEGNEVHVVDEEGE
jgi:hypothetical protein